MSTRWAKLPEVHQSLISEGIAAVRIVYPNKTEEEYHRAEGVLATNVRSRKRGNERIWTLSIGELNFKRVEVLS